MVINRDTIGFHTSFNVTITTREYSQDLSTLTPDQSIARRNIGMMFFILLNWL